MRIAVNCRLLLKDRMEGIAVFTWEICRRMAVDHPEDDFFFFFDRTPASEFTSLQNITSVVLAPQARHPLLWKTWFELSIPRALKKHKIDVFFSPEFYLSKSAKIPTVIVTHDLGFLHYPETYKSSHVDYFKSEVPLFLEKANHIIAVSSFTKNEIIHAYDLAVDNITVVGNACRDSFKVLDEASKDDIRKKVTNGHPYMLYLGSVHPRKNLARLVKAFTIFKKETNNPHKLILYGRWAFKNEELKKLIDASPFKADILLSGDDAIAVEHIVGAATCLVYPSLYEGFGIPIIEAMACGVPVIASDRGAMKEVGGDAACYVDPKNVDSIALALKNVCLETTVDRKKLIENVRRYSWDESAEKVYGVLNNSIVLH